MYSRKKCHGFGSLIFQLAKLLCLKGDPEAGKSYLSLAIAAHVTKGKNLPSYGVAAPIEKREPRKRAAADGKMAPLTPCCRDY